MKRYLREPPPFLKMDNIIERKNVTKKCYLVYLLMKTSHANSAQRKPAQKYQKALVSSTNLEE